MRYRYYLPEEDGVKKEYETKNNSIIIIGANESRRSKLGAWIEQQDYQYVHRRVAQKMIFSENIPFKSYSETENYILYTSDDSYYFNNKNYKWFL